MLIKGNRVKETEYRSEKCGCLIQSFPLPLKSDLKHFLIVTRRMIDEREWSMQKHFHPDHQEYWYIIKGKGQITEGGKTYDVEEGDFIATPPGVPHKASGDMTFVCVMAKRNHDGKLVDEETWYQPVDLPARPPGVSIPKPTT